MPTPPPAPHSGGDVGGRLQRWLFGVSLLLGPGLLLAGLGLGRRRGLSLLCGPGLLYGLGLHGGRGRRLLGSRLGSGRLSSGGLGLTGAIFGLVGAVFRLSSALFRLSGALLRLSGALFGLAGALFRLSGVGEALRSRLPLLDGLGSRCSGGSKELEEGSAFTATLSGFRAFGLLAAGAVLLFLLIFLITGNIT